MKVFSKIVLVLAFLSLAVPSFAQINRNSNFYCDRSASISISTGTTTQIITNDNTADNPTKINICNYGLTIVGTATAQAVTFEYGTGTTCGTGTTVLSGPLTGIGSTATSLFLFASYPFKAIPVINNLCILTTQTGVVSGHISYAIF